MLRVGSIAAGATCDANPRRSLVAQVRSPTASSSRCAARRSKIGGHAPARAGDRSPASSPSAAAGAPDSPGPGLDVRGVPTPAPDRRRSTAGACPDRGWRGPQNQLGRVVARVSLLPWYAELVVSLLTDTDRLEVFRWSLRMTVVDPVWLPGIPQRLDQAIVVGVIDQHDAGVRSLERCPRVVPAWRGPLMTADRAGRTARGRAAKEPVSRGAPCIHDRHLRR